MGMPKVYVHQSSLPIYSGINRIQTDDISINN